MFFILISVRDNSIKSSCHLYRITQQHIHMQLLVIILLPMIFSSQAPRETHSAGGATPHFRYSSLSQEPAEWKLELERPCSGEQTLLMFDRWNKLFKGFYSEKKGKFDISKIPDIYVSTCGQTSHIAMLTFTVNLHQKCYVGGHL